VEGRIDPAHDPALTDADAHLPADHESHAAEHPLHFDARDTCQGSLHSLDERVAPQSGGGTGGDSLDGIRLWMVYA